MNPRSAAPGSVAVVGGGLAGLAAACALAESGFPVTLYERRPYLGGRASSYRHPGTGEVVDNCQHVLMGCCTNLLDLFGRIGVGDRIRWYDTLTFIEPGGRRTEIWPSRLPAPFHSVPAFLRAGCLNVADKAAVMRAMATLLREPPQETGGSFREWLEQQQQTPGAVERFWRVVLVSALNEELERMSVHYAAQVFRESFLKSPGAGRMGVPTVPLSELYEAAGEHIRARGGEVRLRTAVESFRTSAADARLWVEGQEEPYEFVISAVPFDALAQMLPEVATAEPLRETLAKFETSPITGIHLWFDREITDLDHAVLLDRTIQWMFHKSRFQSRPAGSNGATRGSGSYVELVVSSSKALLDMPRKEIIELALRELREFFPAVASARLVKETVVKEVHATYSALPLSDSYRPGSATMWPRFFLCGDWTATGWPATMEGAVRSGYLAAEALLRTAGGRARFLVPDLPASGFMRLVR